MGESRARLRLALLLNQALCESHLGNYRATAALCAQVLEFDPSNLKARFRRAAALGELQEYDAALYDLGLLLALEPGEADAAALRHRLLGKRRALKCREKAQF